MYIEPYYTENDVDGTKKKRPIFGYFNFYGITSSEFLGGKDSLSLGNDGVNFWLKQVLSNVDIYSRNTIKGSPYFLLTNNNIVRSEYQDICRIFFNSKIFYGTTNFNCSNVYGAINLNENYNKTTDLLFLNNTQGVASPQWRGQNNNEGIEITEISTDTIKETTNPPSDSGSNVRFLIKSSGVELFNSSLIGNFGLSKRINSSDNNENESDSIELCESFDITKNDGITSESIQLNCLNFYKVSFVASQKNLFINDYCEWKKDLVDLIIPIRHLRVQYLLVLVLLIEI